MATISGKGTRTVYTSDPVGTTDWVVLFAELPLTVSSMVIADSSGKTMEIGICHKDAQTNAEVRQFLIPPTSLTTFKIQIPKDQRISIRAVSDTATTGENNCNVLF